MVEKITYLQIEIIALYRGNYLKSIYIREMASLLNKSHVTLLPHLKSLESKNILFQKTIGKNKTYTLNLNNIQTKLYLNHSELLKTSQFLEKYPSLKTFLKEITLNIPIIVFGSFAKLSANKNSDIDILVITNTKPALPSHGLPNKIHLTHLTEKNFTKAQQEKEPLMKEIEKNHIILNNHSFYINELWNNYGKQ